MSKYIPKPGFDLSKDEKIYNLELDLNILKNESDNLLINCKQHYNLIMKKINSISQEIIQLKEINVSNKNINQISEKKEKMYTKSNNLKKKNMDELPWTKVKYKKKNK